MDFIPSESKNSNGSFLLACDPVSKRERHPLSFCPDADVAFDRGVGSVLDRHVDQRILTKHRPSIKIGCEEMAAL